MGTVLEIRDLNKSFGKKDILNNLNLLVPEKSIFGFVGRNGAGKTITMKIVLGLLKANEGEVFVCGEKANYGETKTNRHIVKSKIVCKLPLSMRDELKRQAVCRNWIPAMDISSFGRSDSSKAS